MSWILAGVAGLLWLARNEAAPIILAPRMPPALKQQLLVALQQELSEGKLDALVDVLRRANYQGAAEVFSRRRRAARSPSATKASTEAVRAFVASESDPDWLEKMARLLELAGRQDLAPELQQRAAALRTEVQTGAEDEEPDTSDNLETLLGKADDQPFAMDEDEDQDFDDVDEGDDFGELDEADDDSTDRRMLAAGKDLQ